MIKDVVGSKNYNVWLAMLKRLVPYGRTRMGTGMRMGTLVQREITRDINLNMGYGKE